MIDLFICQRVFTWAGWCPILILNYFRRLLLESRNDVFVRLQHWAFKLHSTISERMERCCLQLWVIAAQYCCWHTHMMWHFVGTAMCWCNWTYSGGEVSPCAALQNVREGSGSRSGAAEDSRFLGYDAVWFGYQLPTFRMIAVSSYTGSSSRKFNWVPTLTVGIWIWRYCYVSKRREPLAQRHSVTSQKTWMLNKSAVRGWKLSFQKSNILNLAVLFLDCVALKGK